MSATPRTDNVFSISMSAAQYSYGQELSALGWKDISCEMRDYARKLETELNAKTESADVSAALIAEKDAALTRFLTFHINQPHIAEIASAALAKTPESVGAEVAKLRDFQKQAGDAATWIFDDPTSVGLSKHAKEMLHVLRNDAGNVFDLLRSRIAELETTNRDQLDSLSFCKGEIASLETQRDALILLVRNVVPLLNAQYEDVQGAEGEHAGEEPEDVRHLAAILRQCDEAVKQSGNRPETPDSSMIIKWEEGPARGSNYGTAGTSEDGKPAMWYDGDLLLIVVEVERAKKTAFETALVRVSCDEDYFELRNADDDGEMYDSWTIHEVSWWAKIAPREIFDAVRKTGGVQP